MINDDFNFIKLVEEYALIRPSQFESFNVFMIERNKLALEIADYVRGHYSIDLRRLIF